MKSKKNDSSPQKIHARKPISKVVGVATVFAALGASLGVNVGQLLAADTKEAVQHKTGASLDWGDLNSRQAKLADQIKLIQADQAKFYSQIKNIKQGKLDSIEIKECNAAGAEQLKRIGTLKRNEELVAGVFKFYRPTLKPGSQDQIKLDGLAVNEHKMADQIKMLQANQLKYMDLLKSRK